jgi:predicted glycosyl hydrolase (DUF1957 family)
MLTFEEYQLYGDLEEGAIKDLIKVTIPKPVLHWLKRKLHQDQYKNALLVYQEIMKDDKRNLSHQVALTKAAATVGISAKELQKVWDTVKV